MPQTVKVSEIEFSQILVHFSSNNLLFSKSFIHTGQYIQDFLFYTQVFILDQYISDLGCVTCAHAVAGFARK